MTVLGSRGFRSLDPSAVHDTTEVSVLSGLVVRSLTQYVYDPKTKQPVLDGDLATDLGRPNKNYTMWRYVLRRGVRFQNGRPVTPKDVKYGIERSFDRTDFPAGPNYSNRYLLDGHTYRGPYRSRGNYEGVTVHGRTLTIRTAKPFPDLPYWLASPAMSPMPPGPASYPATYQGHPWATGPYMVEPGSFVPGRSLTLVKNPYWDRETDSGRHQYVDALHFDFAADSAHIDSTLLADTGSAQTSVSVESVIPPYYERFRRTAPDRLVRGTDLCTEIAYPDNRTISDVTVRRALGYAYPYRSAWSASEAVPGVTRLAATDVMPPVVLKPDVMMPDQPAGRS